MTTRSPIAVVGVSAIFPGSVDATGFWKDILAGTDLIRDVPRSHWLIDDYYDPDPAAPDKTYAKRGAFLEDIPFDPLEWGVPPSIVPATDTSQLLALITAKRVLEDAAGGQFAEMDKSRISVILGVTSAQELLGSMNSRLQKPVWRKVLRDAGLPESKVVELLGRIEGEYTPWQEASFPGLLGNVVAGRIANRLDLGGTNCVCDAACASAFSAVSMAANELWLGQSDVVITGGVDTMNDIFMFMCFSKTPALSPSGDVKPFSDEADGTMLGEGMGMVALKRLEDAERDGDRIYAVITGVGSSSDGRAKSVYAPRPSGQASALERAYDAAGYGADTVELVEAHGTGTKAGDAAEFEGLTMAFDHSGRQDRRWCALGSVKSQIGHTKAAAGSAGLFKSVMALHHKVIPPTIKIDRPNPNMDLQGSPFYLSTRARPWVRGPEHPRRAGVSSFGFGGSNFHLALQEYTGDHKASFRRWGGPEIVVFGADSSEALLAQLRSLDLSGDGWLEWLARDSQQSYSGGQARLAIVASDVEDFRTKLELALSHLQDKPGKPLASPKGIHYGFGEAGKTAFVFPGQGSQYVDMGAQVAMTWPEAVGAWDAAEGAVAGLADIVFPRPDFSATAEDWQTRLTATEWAQPAIGACSLSLLRVLSRLGVSADCVGGHSYGEVTALHAAGVLSAEDMLRVARRRGELMAQAAKTPGSMTAVVADIESVRPVVEDSGLDVVVANHNSPRQVVLSGPTKAIDGIEQALDAAGLPFRRLGVATAFHSSVVSDSVGPFAEALAEVDFATPTLPVYANSEAAPYPSEPAAIRELLAGQIARSVRFVDQVEAMYAAGVRVFVEVGPHAVLTGLVARILKGRPHAAVPLDKKGKDGLVQLQDGLGRLVAAGVEVQLSKLWEGWAEAVDPRSLPAPKMLMHINGANYGKPYPPPEGQMPGPNPELEPEVIVKEVIKEVRVEVPVEVPVQAPVQAPGRAAARPAADGWVQAFQESQRQTVEAHSAFQDAMTRSHTVFLESMERSFGQLTSMVTGAPAPQPPARVAQPAAVAAPAPVAAPASVPVPLAAAPIPTSTPAVAAPAVDLDALMSAPQPVAPVASVAPVAPPASLDLHALLLSVVADKTGYPAEMLSAEMSLEGDLGIDSIKRVEILSAMREEAPELPEVDAGAMAELKTLGQIVEHMAAALPGATAAPAPGATAAPAAVPTLDLHALLLSVVADKTGYPAEMLSAEMSLEGDLGIDSIKRVEILSAMRDEAPELPEVDAGAMAELKTLGQIVEHMGAALGGTPVAAAPAPVATSSAPPAELGRYVVRAVEAEAHGLSLRGLAGAGPLYIVGGDDFAPALAEEFRGRGIASEVVGVLPEGASKAILLGGLDPIEDIDAALEIERAAFRAARTLAPNARLLVTVQDTGGDFGIAGSDRAFVGGLAALAKTAAQEWPEAGVKAIDLQIGDRDWPSLATALAAELLEGGAEPEVGLAADGTRMTLSAVLAPVEGGEVTVSEGSVVLASGGARGVTAATLIALSEKTKARFVLLGRTKLVEEDSALAGLDEIGLKRALLTQAKGSLSPAEVGRQVRGILAQREIRETLATLEQQGSPARYLSVDVTDHEALEAALGPVRDAFGPISVVVHGAGVLRDKFISDKTDEDFDLVFGTKVGGLRALLDATRHDPLDALVLFSSVAARGGNAGQCDYAMANEVLNKVAALEARKRPGLLVKSLGWGPWEGGMVTPALKARFEALGVPLIPLEVGAAMLVDELLGSSRESIELVLGGEPKREALLSAGDTEVRFDYVVTKESHPWLADHSIQGKPVVPVVLATEWFARAARATRPDLELVAVRDIKVLRGIRLSNFEDGQAFTVTSRQLSNGNGALVGLELRSGDTLHYTASAELAISPRAATGGPSTPKGLEAWTDAVYDGHVLFHGPEFQVIKKLEGVSDDGAAAELAGVHEQGWSAQWTTDVAAMDGGLQLAVLWAKKVLGGASLPTKLGELRIYPGGPSKGLMKAVLTPRKVSGSITISDIHFVESDGSTVAELKGVETCLRPS